jgi:hypothetical protein
VGYKLPHRHCSFSIGQSFCLPSSSSSSPKTLASLPSSKQMASNKRASKGSSGAPPPLHPRLG